MENFTDWKDELIDQARQEIEQKDTRIEKMDRMLLISVAANGILAGVVFSGFLFYMIVIAKLIG